MAMGAALTPVARYHGNGLPSRKKPLVRPLSGSVATDMTLAAPSSTPMGSTVWCPYRGYVD